MPPATLQTRERPAYGTDAPGIMAGLLGCGAALIAAALLLAVFHKPSWLHFAALILAIAGFIPFFFGCQMLAYRLLGKRRMRDLMLSSLDWSGSEQVLDIGTGAGLLAIGAAKHLTTGRATGIDIWVKKDLSNNTQAATERNIRLEGVQGRVVIQTADATSLPLADNSIDVALSLLCLHNIEDKQAQAQACREIARVLKPGGTALLADYVPTHAYRDALSAAGLTIAFSKPFFGTALSLMWMVRAQKPRLPSPTN